MFTYSALKKNARLSLRGNWGGAVCAALSLGTLSLLLALLRQELLYLFASAPPGEGDLWVLHRQAGGVSSAEWIISVSTSLLGLLACAPLALGVAGWFRSLGEGNRPEGLFRHFTRPRLFLRAVWLEIQLTLRPLFWALAFFALPAGTFLASYRQLVRYGQDGLRSTATLATLGFLLGVALTLLALVLYFASMNKYALAAYLLAGDDGLSASRALRESARLTRGHRFSLLWFRLSFAGWILLSVLLLPALYALPYLQASTALYFRQLLEGERAPRGLTQEFSTNGRLPRVEPNPQ